MNALDDFHPGAAYAAQLDEHDAMGHLRHHFVLPENTSYLCGNCLGLQPKAVGHYLQEVLEGWGDLGFRAHFSEPYHWKTYEEDHLIAPMAAIVGALPSETTLMNSLSVNLHLMMASFYRPRPGKQKILVEEGAFPSDRFVVASQIALRGLDPADVLVEAPRDARTGFLSNASIVDYLHAHGDEIALVLLGNTSYRNGQVLDTAAITEAGHRRGCMVGFDLAHAAGNIELSLHDWDVDFAVWCNYKYMNAGPGSVAGCFVHERHHHEAMSPVMPRMQGWWGDHGAERFNMASGRSFRPTEGAGGWRLSSPPILSMAALRAALEVFDEAGGMRRLRRKRIELGRYLDRLVDTVLAPYCESLTPKAEDERGCQFTLKVKADARTLQAALLAHGVVTDVHGPDLIRVTPVPLYNTFTDVHRLATHLQASLDPAHRHAPPGGMTVAKAAA